MATLSDFRTRFPEFVNASDAMVSAALTDAEAWVDAATYGTKFTVAHLLRAAHQLAVNPLAEYARLVSDDGSTVYLRQYELIKRMVAGGPQVI